MLKKITSIFMAIVMLGEVLSPTVVYALSGGPTQPEFQQFAPAGVNDMVDLFSGDFKYNIPLMDVEGYPININYASGVTLEQEASWVGLGWSLNTGSINRNMRGLPDDFKGDEVIKKMNLKKNVTIGGSLGGSIELFGSDKLGLNLNASLGAKYNNYEGLSVEQSVGTSLRIGETGKNNLNVGLGITSTGDEGLTVQPTISLSTKASETEKGSSINRRTSFTVGTAFNSRSGMKSLSLSSSTSYSNSTKYNGELSSVGASSSTSASFDLSQPTYTPSVTMPMVNESYTGRFTAGGELFGLNGHVFISGFYASNKLDKNSSSNPAFGYLYSELGSNNGSALMDFNREKEGSVNNSTPALAIPNYTCDIFSVTGQGVGGSFRPFRSSIGHVFDANNGSRSTSGSLGVEIGAGNAIKVGVDISVTTMNSSSGKWSGENAALNATNFKKSSDPLFENVYFKEAGEKSVDSDPAFTQLSASSGASYLTLHKLGRFAVMANNKLSDGTTLGNNTVRQARDKRNQLFTFIRRSEMEKLAIQEPVSNIYTAAPGHHIGEITVTGTDGRRYIYGLPVYNKMQEEATFAVDPSVHAPDCETGMIPYDAADADPGNQKGRDNFYSSTKTPPYPSTFLLTSLLSSDYADADNERGPSEGDVGSYTKFKYRKAHEAFKWRSPMTESQYVANYNRGLNYDDLDDKASFVYGEKEIWYLEEIETRNYKAVFITGHVDPVTGLPITANLRWDAREAAGRDGGVGSGQLQKLMCIKLYSKKDLNRPIKEVYFEYDYSLGNNVTNSYQTSISSKKGKLTLKRISFVYQDSYRAKFSPYEFTYNSGPAVDYNPKDVDRWGNYKLQEACNFTATGPLSNAEFPYSTQEKSTADINAAAWNLTEIKLPSEGIIKVDYESDDYAYVQNKRANRMFKVVSCDENDLNPLVNPDKSFVGASSGNFKLIVKLDEDFSLITNDDLYFYENYLKDLKYIYFQFLMRIMKSGSDEVWETVPGYAEFTGSPGNCGVFSNSGNYYGWIQMNSVSFKDAGTPEISPMTKAAIQFGRLNLSRKIWGNPGINEDEGLSEEIIKALVASDVVGNIKAAVTGPNKHLHNDGNVLAGQKFLSMKSWIRLKEPTGKKLGGGARVKRITMEDSWNGMSGEASSKYGQEYDYTLDGKMSSGVAAYEPTIGGEENPLKQPVFHDAKKLLAPDDKFYMEEPFGECFFPGPTIGYSKVSVTDYVPSAFVSNYTQHATGKVVNEFYTTKDFPTIFERSRLDHVRDKDNPMGIRSLLKIDVRDVFTASQGFSIELNDMNGKQKAVKIYAADQDDPITSTEYYYQSTPHVNGSFRLTNNCTVIDRSGDYRTTQIGVSSDAVADYRESNNTTFGVTAAGNTDGFVIPLIVPIFIPVPMLWPSFNSDRTQFRSAVFVKVIQRFGILERTVVKDLGSTVETKNIAYDSETGDVLLTSTANEFNDPVYSLKYPAYWYYDAMGPAYKNIGYVSPPISMSNGKAAFSGAGYFVEGDELAVIRTSDGYTRQGWVTEKTNNDITIVDKLGAGFMNDNYVLRIMRSGRKNQQSQPMATLLTKTNPLPYLKNNLYNHVLQAGAIEYSNTWRVFCDCFDNSTSTTPVTINPYLTGKKGSWRPFRNYTYLTGRTQSNYNNNTNIRNDGEFTSYSPFYECSNNSWKKNDKDWTFASEVTQYNSYGAELENKDALGIFSAATYSFNQTQITAVASNAKLRDIGYASFEDYNSSPCNDKHFRIDVPPSELDIEAHTGYHSLLVNSSSDRDLTVDVAVCNPELECMLAHNVTEVTVNGMPFYQIDFTGGELPLSIDYEVLNGNSNIYVGCNGNCILIQNPGSGRFVDEIKLIDSKNCTKQLLFNYNEGDYTIN